MASFIWFPSLALVFSSAEASPFDTVSLASEANAGSMVEDSILANVLPALPLPQGQGEELHQSGPGGC